MLRRTFLKGLGLSPLGLLAGPVLAQKPKGMSMVKFREMAKMFDDADARHTATEITTLKKLHEMLYANREYMWVFPNEAQAHALGTKRIFPDGIERTYVKFG